jgi:DNA-directed RNA polymerase specialized sigma24 family protein
MAHPDGPRPSPAGSDPSADPPPARTEPRTLDDHQLHTTSLLDMLTRYRDGDTAALDALLRRIGERLERLASRMLRRYPVVREREQTDDVLNNALVRLTRALREVRPSSTAGFFGLAAEQIRRELLDLARYHRRRAGVQQPFVDAEGQLDLVDPNIPDPRDLDRWLSLHEAVERLPVELAGAPALGSGLSTPQ